MEEGECFSCDKCNFQTTTQGQLEKHRINRHVTFSCDLCNFEAAKKRVLRDHLRFKHYRLTYNCELCAKKFNGKMFLKRHMFKVHSSQLSRCKQCGVKYLELFKKHKCKNIAFFCNGCDKVFKRKDRAKEHAIFVVSSVRGPIPWEIIPRASILTTSMILFVHTAEKLSRGRINWNSTQRQCIYWKIKRIGLLKATKVNHSKTV